MKGKEEKKRREEERNRKGERDIEVDLRKYLEEHDKVSMILATHEKTCILVPTSLLFSSISFSTTSPCVRACVSHFLGQHLAYMRSDLCSPAHACVLGA